MEAVSVDYLYLLHTDTFVYDTSIFDVLMQRLLACGDKTVAIGCRDQIDRGRFRSSWRTATRYLKYHSRKLKLTLGLKSREPKPYKEIYLKSFCALWNVRMLKLHKLRFSDSDRTPGYEAQDHLTRLGYHFEAMPEHRMFKYLDHIEAGTISAIGGYSPNHRRLKKYQEILANARTT